MVVVNTKVICQSMTEFRNDISCRLKFFFDRIDLSLGISVVLRGQQMYPARLQRYFK